MATLKEEADIGVARRTLQIGLNADIGISAAQAALAFEEGQVLPFVVWSQYRGAAIRCFRTLFCCPKIQSADSMDFRVPAQAALLAPTESCEYSVGALRSTNLYQSGRWDRLRR